MAVLPTMTKSSWRPEGEFGEIGARNSPDTVLERLAFVASATGLGVWERDIASNRVIWSDTMHRLFGREPGQFSGSPDEVLSFVHPSDRAEFRRVYEASVRGTADAFEQEFRIVYPDGQVRWVQRRGQVRRDAEGRPLSVLGVALDITDRKRTEEENARLAALTSAADDAIMGLAPDGTILTWNPAAERMFGYSAQEIVGQSAKILYPPGAGREFESIYQRVREGEHFRAEGLRQDKAGHQLNVAISMAPVRSRSGRVVGVAAVVRDISDRIERETHIRFLMSEVTHRSKNLLAVVQAIASQTARSATSPVDFATDFGARLKSLAASLDLVVRQDWRGVSVRELVHSQLACHAEPDGTQFELEGGEVMLSPQASQYLGMALHELATNAVKYGALSNEAGTVRVRWQLAGPDDARRFQLTWVESGGPPVLPPRKKGFGHLVIERMAADALQGNVRLEFAPEGVRWSLDADAAAMLKEIAEPGA